MIYTVKWTEKAKKDYFEIIDYLLENWSINSAKIFKNRTTNSIYLISKMPLMYPLVRYRENIRKCSIVKQVSVFYIVDDVNNGVVILRFYDNRRDNNNLSEILKS